MHPSSNRVTGWVFKNFEKGRLFTLGSQFVVSNHYSCDNGEHCAGYWVLSLNDSVSDNILFRRDSPLKGKKVPIEIRLDIRVGSYSLAQEVENGEVVDLTLTLPSKRWASIISRIADGIKFYEDVYKVDFEIKKVSMY